jgi:RNA-directed DNA polymerase
VHAQRDWSRPAAARLRDPRAVVATGLAAAFLAGGWELPAMTRRGQRAVGQRRVWLRDLAQAARSEYADAPVDRPRQLAGFLAGCPALLGAFERAAEHGDAAPRVVRWYLPATAMGPSPWPVTRLDTVGDVQDLVGLHLGELLWLADARRLEPSVLDERLRHYRYRWITKRSGVGRLIEEPKPLLKHVQRVILREILNAVPVHDAAHGFRRGRSAVTFAVGHAGHDVVVHLDVEDFFGAVPAGRVYGIFRGCGYPEPVAHLLTSLTTNSTPGHVWSDRPHRPSGWRAGTDFRMGQRLRHPHLPQGAPTSPAIANLAAFRLDCRLSGLGGAAQLHYSRYADDMAFSGDSALTPSRAQRLVRTVQVIAGEEGFRLNPAKTFIQRSAQRQLLAGLVINERPNVARDEYDRLKAILHNSIRLGPDSQNRNSHPNFAAHLLGRISRVRQVNPVRGSRLLVAYDQINWS